MDNMFTPSAKHVLALAHEQAKYFKHQAVGTEHLLLALAIEREGIASKIFEQFSITSDDIQEEIERMIGYGTMDDMGPADYLPYSPKARQVLALAGQEAQHYCYIPLRLPSHLKSPLAQRFYRLHSITVSTFFFTCCPPASVLN